MANLNCKQCGRTLFSGATVCPKCGLKDPLKTSQEQSDELLEEIRQRQDRFDKQSRGEIPRDPTYWRKQLICWGLTVLMLAGATLWLAKSCSEAGVKDAASQAQSDAADRCFGAGSALATASIANIQNANSVGLSPADMRERLCQQKFESEGAACIRHCQDGFTFQAKSFVKSR